MWGLKINVILRLLRISFLTKYLEENAEKINSISETLDFKIRIAPSALAFVNITLKILFFSHPRLEITLCHPWFVTFSACEWANLAAIYWKNTNNIKACLFSASIAFYSLCFGNNVSRLCGFFLSFAFLFSPLTFAAFSCRVCQYLWSGYHWTDLFLLQNLSLNDVTFGQRWWHQKCYKGQRSSRPAQASMG